MNDESMCSMFEVFATTCSQSAVAKHSPPLPIEALPALRVLEMDHWQS